jgi:hypothetical protein
VFAVGVVAGVLFVIPGAVRFRTAPRQEP